MSMHDYSKVSRALLEELARIIDKFPTMNVDIVSARDAIRKETRLKTKPEMARELLEALGNSAYFHPAQRETITFNINPKDADRILSLVVEYEHAPEESDES